MLFGNARSTKKVASIAVVLLAVFLGQDFLAQIGTVLNTLGIAMLPAA